IPFGSSRWPFDVRGKEMSFAPESYDARNAGVNSLGDQWVGGLEGNSETVEFDSLSGAAGSEVASEIVASGNFNLFKNILDPEFIECLISWANQQRHSYSQQT